MKIENKNLEQVRTFYDKKYVKIFNALENVGATNFKVDEDCGKWLELWCDIKNEHIKINIGIDDKFHISRLNCHERSTFNSQIEIVNYINNICGKKFNL